MSNKTRKSDRLHEVGNPVALDLINANKFFCGFYIQCIRIVAYTRCLTLYRENLPKLFGLFLDLIPLRSWQMDIKLNSCFNILFILICKIQFCIVKFEPRDYSKHKFQWVLKDGEVRGVSFNYTDLLSLSFFQ